LRSSDALNLSTILQHNRGQKDNRIVLCKMQNSGTSSQANQKNQSNGNTQQQTTFASSNNSFQSSSNNQTTRSSFLQKWFGGQSEQQEKDKLINGKQKSGGISWGEDVHYII